MNFFASILVYFSISWREKGENFRGGNKSDQAQRGDGPRLEQDFYIADFVHQQS
jgi:hypothetical protein